MREVKHLSAMIRHKPKLEININELLIELENPTTDNIEELNRKLGKYLDNICEPFNLSFWQTVKFDYWTHLNLLKLTDKIYDADAEDFIKQVYKITNKNLKNSPKAKQKPVAKSWFSDINVSRSVRYVVGGTVALFVIGATVKYMNDE